MWSCTFVHFAFQIAQIQETEKGIIVIGNSCSRLHTHKHFTWFDVEEYNKESNKMNPDQRGIKAVLIQQQSTMYMFLCLYQAVPVVRMKRTLSLPKNGIKINK